MFALSSSAKEVPPVDGDDREVLVNGKLQKNSVNVLVDVG